MKTTEQMQDRARARQERIAESQARFRDIKHRNQERQSKDNKQRVSANLEAPIVDGSKDVLPREPIQNAPTIAKSLREQILAPKQGGLEAAAAENFPSLDSLPQKPSGSPKTTIDSLALQTRMLNELRLATISRIDNGEWDEYFQSLISLFLRESESETRNSSKLSSESD